MPPAIAEAIATFGSPTSNTWILNTGGLPKILELKVPGARSGSGGGGGGSSRSSGNTKGDDEALKEAASKAMADALHKLRREAVFRVLDRWRGENYAVYGEGGKVLLEMERSATPLFGVVTYGVHMTVFSRLPSGGSGGDSCGNTDEYKIWVPRRAKNKQTYPSMLDNSVAGGIAVEDRGSAWTCLMREAWEEAGLKLDEEPLTGRTRSAGAVTYFHVRGASAGGETGLCQPECQYVYDLDLTGVADVDLRPNDDEVERFEVMGVQEIMGALVRGEFKPNCALVMVDFLVRHGLGGVDAGMKRFAEITSRLHRGLEFPMK